MASLEALVKDFHNAADDKRKEALSKLEEEAAKLSGSAAKYQLPPLLTMFTCCQSVMQVVALPVHDF